MYSEVFYFFLRIIYSHRVLSPVFCFIHTFVSFILAQIMHAFSVAPFDQNLSIDGKILSDDCATLGTLGVIPESVILLKVRNGSVPEGFRGFSCVNRVRW